MGKSLGIYSPSVLRIHTERKRKIAARIGILRAQGTRREKIGSQMESISVSNRFRFIPLDFFLSSVLKGEI